MIEQPHISPLYRTTLLCNGQGIHHPFNLRPRNNEKALVSLSVKDGEFLGLGYEYFHLELGAVSSVLINKRGVSEHSGVKQSPQKIATHDFLPKRQTEPCHQRGSIGTFHRCPICHDAYVGPRCLLTVILRVCGSPKSNMLYNS